MYKLEDIIYKNDNFNTFIKKYTYNNSEFAEEVKSKLLECINKYNKKDINKINAKFIMEELYLGEEEVNQNKEIFGPITGFRRLPEKHKINVEKNNKYYLSCKFGPTNFCKLTISFHKNYSFLFYIFHKQNNKSLIIFMIII